MFGLTATKARDALPTGHRLGWRAGARERRRLARHDRLNAQLAELHHIRTLVAGAHTVVRSAWVQHGWFAYRDEEGRQRTVTALDAHRLAGRPVTGGCLVGAVVQAGGGLAEVRTQPVQRALELTWHTLFGDEDEPVRWCPAPSVRAAHIREITRWNDHPGRTVQEVTAVLYAVERAARLEIGQIRERQHLGTA
jgi:hypothetical protein